MNELREHETPFELGYALLRSSMYYLSKLTLERNSPKLAEIEKHECDKLIKRCNDTIEQTFDVLGKIDIDQTMALKNGLDSATTYVGYELDLAKNSTSRQKRRAHKIAVKIERET